MALVLPPLVQSTAILLDTGTSTADSLAGIMSPLFSTTLLQGALAAVLLARSRSLSLLAGIPVSEGRREAGQAGSQKKGWKGRLTGGGGRIAAALVVLAVLLANSLLWNLLSPGTASPSVSLGDSGGVEPAPLPLLLVATAVAACYEEILYRWYGPRLLGQVLDWKARSQNRFPRVCMEGAMVAVFALAHGYGGWLAVGNALVAGILLRSATLMTGSPLTSILSHLVYNLVQLFLLLG